MDRSLAGRAAIGRLPRPRASPAPRARSRLLAACLALARGALSSLWRRRRLRLAILSLALAAPLLIGGWRWLRDSSLVSVQRVHVTGVHGSDAASIGAALTAAARHMSTLDVRIGQLRAAVAPFHLVRDLRVSASFPHGLNIQVIEQPPVAALASGLTRTAVAADGVVLGPALLSGSLPVLSAASAPSAGAQVQGAALLGALSALGAVPAPLARWVARAYTGPKGLTMAMRNGLLAYFGDSSRAHAKWLSLARVLADTGSAGASYVDVRLPERPVAGFPPGTVPPAGATAGPGGTSEQTGTTESMTAAIAAALKAAGGSSSGEAPVGAGEGSAGASGATRSTPTGTGETSSTPAAAPAAAGETSSTPAAAAPAAGPEGSPAGGSQAPSAPPAGAG